VVAALKMLALLGEPGTQPREDDEARVFALCALVAAQQCSGDLEAADAALKEAMTVARRSGLERSRLDCLSWLALLEAVRGRLHAAARAAGETLQIAEQHGWSGTPQAARAHLALTMVHGHRNEPALADQHLEQVIATSRDGYPPVLLGGVSIVHAWLRLTRGDFARARFLIGHVREHQAGRRPPAYMERSIAVMEAGLRAVTGDMPGARELLGRAEEAGQLTGDEAMGLAWLELADGDPVAAAATLAPSLNGLAPVSSFAVLTQAWLLDGIAARALDDDERAFRSLERALTLAEQEGFRLLFLAGGPAVRELLTRQLHSDTAHRKLVADLLETLEAMPSPEPPAAHGQLEALIDPLSDRERIVLRYLGGVLSNVEIASELYVSVNTVKTHVKSIYRKLEVTGRRDAVRRARELRLL
jgi:LuxR family transcriptional regulator, maltose regulon positive regulatory protein